MKKEKHPKNANENTKEMNAEEINKGAENPEVSGTSDVKGDETVNTEIEELKANLEEKAKQCEDFKNMVQRTAAEFDNYKKRTIKEKEALSLDIAIDTVNTFLPVVDNLERALKAAEDMENNPLKEGVEMVMRQLKDCLDKLGVEAIEAVNNSFDPELHNAVMHVTDDEVGENIVVEEFQKGYTMKGKVIRHSMVKVVN
ncbi:nucleotide exchange factor GrpE [Ruminiclostridium papyrosolvens]|uniref:Protein GrpE n=1 Tax=Ruminiclostridium papyrosolvens C7 TaxID=1330534 RepID=U4R4H9_9FIRM|nr:nucleotide exchange factor GrpE [Ruminiclostridium papyrosolvens]EPR13288.1 molecular chaperone GrpE [Ruminiclostridium papyrosolvens C7]